MTSQAGGPDPHPPEVDATGATPTEADLLAAHRAARARRAAAPLGGKEYLEAIEEIARIEVELARVGREASPPKI